jgi:hypothetical protein
MLRWVGGREAAKSGHEGQFTTGTRGKKSKGNGKYRDPSYRSFAAQTQDDGEERAAAKAEADSFAALRNDNTRARTTTEAGSSTSLGMTTKGCAAE